MLLNSHLVGYQMTVTCRNAPCTADKFRPMQTFDAAPQTGHLSRLPGDPLRVEGGDRKMRSFGHSPSGTSDDRTKNASRFHSSPCLPDTSQWHRFVRGLTGRPWLLRAQIEAHVIGFVGELLTPHKARVIVAATGRWRAGLCVGPKRSTPSFRCP